jgi:hypothetical protein
MMLAADTDDQARGLFRQGKWESEVNYAVPDTYSDIIRRIYEISGKS